MPLVAVVMGSKSDAEAMQPALDVLKELGIDYEVNVISAHRSPEKTSPWNNNNSAQRCQITIW